MSVTPVLEADALSRQDPELAEILRGELDRQSTTLQLTAAENFASPAVLATLGSALANKYAEGYPGSRYHGAARWPTPPNASLSSAPRRCSAPNTPTSSPRPAPRPSWPPTRPCCAPVTPSSP